MFQTFGRIFDLYRFMLCQNMMLQLPFMVKLLTFMERLCSAFTVIYAWFKGTETITVIKL